MYRLLTLLILSSMGLWLLYVHDLVPLSFHYAVPGYKSRSDEVGRLGGRSRPCSVLRGVSLQGESLSSSWLRLVCI